MFVFVWTVKLTSAHIRRLSSHGDMPRILRQRVCDTRIHAPRHALRKGFIVVLKGDGIRRQRRQVPEVVRPVVCPAVERVITVVLLEVVGHVVEREGAVADTVDVAPRDGVVNRVAGVDSWGRLVLGSWEGLGGGGGFTVVGGVVVSKDDITLDTVLVLDKEVCQRGGVWDELPKSSVSHFNAKYGGKRNSHKMRTEGKQSIPWP